MKSLLILILFVSTFKVAMTQNVVTTDYVLKSPIKIVNTYSLPNDSTCVIIPFDYAEPISRKHFDSIFKNRPPIISIDYVYTHYKTSPDFDQNQLNTARIEHLKSIAPSIFDNNLIEWTFYEQKNNLDREGNKALFHGFVIHFLADHYYAGNDGKFDVEKEINLIKTYLSTVYPDSTVSEISKIEVETIPQHYLPILKGKRDKGITYDKKFILWREHVPTAYKYDTLWADKLIRGHFTHFNHDTVVTKTLRKYGSDWTNLILVEDVTGSMYPYIAQTLAWKKLRLDSTRLQHFVFFNDGDHYPDGPIGKSGGAYYIHSDDFDTVSRVAYSTMQKGRGGQAPENNIEATLFAETQYADAPAYILIADNYAPIRDPNLIRKLDKPTHIILCGVKYGKIHHSYIKLAIATGGTLHTIEEDIDAIPILKTGDIFEVAGQKFRYISKGQIVLVR